MKNYILTIATLLLLVACTKEGLQGPDGAEGPEGEPGADGTGNNGAANTTVISYHTTTPATFAWKPGTSTSTDAVYQLTWKVPSNPFVADFFSIDDDMEEAIKKGSFFVYVSAPSFAGDEKLVWHQLPYTGADFYSLTSYRYTFQQANGSYEFKIFADLRKDTPGGNAPPRILFNHVKAVFLPDVTGVGDPFIN